MPKQAERTELKDTPEKNLVCFAPKQRDFYRYATMGFSPAQAAKKAHYKSPYTMAAYLVENCRWAPLFRQAFADAGFSTPEIVEKAIDLVNATRTISASVVVKSDDPAVRDQKANGLTVDFIDVPDSLTQLRALEFIAKVQDLMTPDKHEVTGANGGPIPISGKVIYVSNIPHNGKEEKKCQPQSKKKKK